MAPEYATHAPCTVEFKGEVIGSIVPHSLGVQFISADRRVAQMDRSIWPSLEYALTAARQVAAEAPATDRA